MDFGAFQGVAGAQNYNSTSARDTVGMFVAPSTEAANGARSQYKTLGQANVF